MKKHPTDLFALLTGLAFAIAGGSVIVSQSTSSPVSGRAAAAAGLILLGVVALAVTLLRNQPAPADVQPAESSPADDPWVSPEERSG